MTKEAVMAAIKECAEKLGHAPSLTELQSMTEVSKRSIRKHFCTYVLALQACGLERTGCGYYVSMETLFKEWAGAVRRLAKIPTIAEFELRGRFSARPLMTRFKTWNSVPQCLLEYARKEGLQEEWSDVLEIIAGHTERRRRSGIPLGTPSGTPTRSRILPNAPIYGTPLLRAALLNAPTNEAEVMFLFASMARELGYAALKVRMEFPDCIALRTVDHERSQMVRIEFEYESRNFLVHLHDVKGCDMIVCWRHNWEDCPLEVLELREVIGTSGDRVMGTTEKQHG
ncbi:MAG TPA: hypothetical protein VKH81_00355 [Candidatus Angelobacter sp.]|nr:hypothetical protein [Candidatus Angelobacter sp.]